MRSRATLRKPEILSRRFFSLLVRAAVITSMSFGVAFGFLSGTTGPGAHYDPYLFAIGVAGVQSHEDEQIAHAGAATLG